MFTFGNPPFGKLIIFRVSMRTLSKEELLSNISLSNLLRNRSACMINSVPSGKNATNWLSPRWVLLLSSMLMASLEGSQAQVWLALAAF